LWNRGLAKALRVDHLAVAHERHGAHEVMRGDERCKNRVYAGRVDSSPAGRRSGSVAGA
jgi:hypothetical protein